MTTDPVLGHAFVDATLLERALTHRSAGHLNNERLEFLGDALLNLFVAELVYEQYPRADEGEMTRLRAALVNGAALAELARAEELGDRLHLGPGELKSGGFRRESILADAFEAVLAAIYVDSGWSACRDTVRRLFATRVAAGANTPKDAKTRLQELLQSRNLPLPAYELVGSWGEEHARIFEAVCRIDSADILTRGSASSRRAAEQIAAEQALTQLERSFSDE
ncbi:ribonuclease III [Dokdonella sp.]|uniref:ribonuclease III n=1 Tax=Dokdonella sp. TaxID=2291710 RepID=UPI001B15F6D5|nr:ribonuclease III [Dokdonella sp.]MBO9663475.1 ribonuclease III [Dokdonella sp.]